MFTTRNLLVAALFGVAIVGCSSSPQRINSTEKSVSFTFEEGEDLKEVTRRASDYCAQHGGVATLRNVGKAEDRSVATFDCA